MIKPKVFISYAKEDRAYVYELSKHLTGLIRTGLIETWSDLGVKPGTLWETEIKLQLEAADIIIFLVSSDFIDSDYINDVEIRAAIKRHNKGEVFIVPIIIRPCNFESLDISKFQALPKHAQPISTWEDEDEAWIDVLNGIKMVISDFYKKEKIQPANSSNIEESINAPKSFVDKLKSEIEKGNIENAIKELLTISKENNNDLYNYVIMLLVRFKSYKRNSDEGLISKGQAQLTKNQIKNTLLSILNSSNEYVK